MCPLCVPHRLGAHRVRHNNSSKMIIKSIQPTAQIAPAQHRRYREGWYSRQFWGGSTTDHLLSMELRSGYHHFCLHPDMRKYFTVRVVLTDGVERYFQYLVLPCGWSRSCYWFCCLVQSFWTMVKKTLGHRVLSYVDDFAFAPPLGRAATADDCRKASRRLDELLRRYGLTRHRLKGACGACSQCLQHLGFVIDTHRGLFGVPAVKLEAISGMARQMLARARRHRRLIRSDTLESCIGKAQSLRLAVSDAFRLRALYDCVPSRGAVGTRSDFIGSRFRGTPTTRISHLAQKDIQFWRDLPQKLHHCPIWPKELTPTAKVHTDASMSACGAMLSQGEHEAGKRVFLRMPWLLGRFSQGIGARYCSGTDDGEIAFERVLRILCSA
jgi:hypothetical protein